MTKNKDKQRHKQYYQEHKEEFSEKARLYRISHKEEITAYRKAHAEKFKIAQRELRRVVKESILNHYGHKCQWEEGCDITDSDMLQIDHINGDGYKQRKEGIIGNRLYSWLIKNNFPKGYRLLCANHNWKHRANMFRQQIKKDDQK